jgi:2-polyprenyl-3-methyl-5-hydroxy-6-metoxy-1,4-benzoquinol methylase
MKPLDCQDIYADADFYDQEFAHREHEIPFFVKQAQLSSGPVLEVGCGTGRITLPIARTGAVITGLDVSSRMLERARRKADEEKLSVTWLEQDCRNINATQAFGLILSATNAMQHLHDLDSVNAFLTASRNALRAGGTVILDVFNPDPAKLARTAAVRYHHKAFVDANANKMHVEAASEYNSATQILAFTLFYLCGGKLVRTKRVNMRCFFPEELLALCQFNGLDVVRRYGNYDETPFRKDSPKQIILCRKKP